MDEIGFIRLLRALAQPHRLRAYMIVAKAGAHGISPSSLADALGISRSLLTSHLAALVEAGLVDRIDHGRGATLQVDATSSHRLISAFSDLLRGNARAVEYVCSEAPAIAFTADAKAAVARPAASQMTDPRR